MAKKQNFAFITTTTPDKVLTDYKQLGPQSLPTRYVRKVQTGVDENGVTVIQMRDVLPGQFVNAQEYMNRFAIDAHAGNAFLASTITFRMQNFIGDATLGYPVGVFNVNGVLLGQATDDASFVTKWNSDASNQAFGTLVLGAAPMQFGLQLLPAMLHTPPPQITGCRFYTITGKDNQYIGCQKGDYVDWGDGNKGPAINWLKWDSKGYGGALGGVGITGYVTYNQPYWMNSRYLSDQSVLDFVFYSDERQHCGIFKNVAVSSQICIYHSEYGPISLHTNFTSGYGFTMNAPMTITRVQGNFPQYCDHFGCTMNSPYTSFPDGFGPASGTNFTSLQNIRCFSLASWTYGYLRTLFPDITNLKKSCYAFHTGACYSGLDGWEFGAGWTALRFFKFDYGAEPFTPTAAGWGFPPNFDDMLWTWATMTAAKADAFFIAADRDIKTRPIGRKLLQPASGASVNLCTAASLAARNSLIAKGWNIV